MEESGNVKVKVLPKLPNQDLNIETKTDTTIADQMADTRYKVHPMFGHMFHDRVWKEDLRRRESRI